MRKLLFGACLLAPLACSLVVDTYGLSGTAAPLDAGAGAGFEASDDASTDAAIPDGSGACPTTTVEQTFESSFDPFVSNGNAQSAGYPNIEVLDGLSAAVLLALAPQRANAYAQVFYPKRIDLTSFSVGFEARMVCPQNDAKTCGDGISFLWIDADDVQVLSNAYTGGGVGAPLGVMGAGVVLDLYNNQEFGDLTDHGIEVVKLSPGADAANGYPWLVSGTSVDLSTKWHSIQIDRRGARVDVKLDGVEAVGANLESPSTGIFGFGAGTGGLIASLGLRNFKGSFSSCP